MNGRKKPRANCRNETDDLTEKCDDNIKFLENAKEGSQARLPRPIGALRDRQRLWEAVIASVHEW